MYLRCFRADQFFSTSVCFYQETEASLIHGGLYSVLHHLSDRQGIRERAVNVRFQLSLTLTDIDFSQSGVSQWLKRCGLLYRNCGVALCYCCWCALTSLIGKSLKTSPLLLILSLVSLSFSPLWSIDDWEWDFFQVWSWCLRSGQWGFWLACS